MTRSQNQRDSRSSGTSRDSHSRNRVSSRVSPQHLYESSNHGRTTSYTTRVFDQHPGFYGYVFHVQTNAVPNTAAAHDRYHPQHDPQYVHVPRTSRTDYSHLNHDNVALNMAPIPSRRQTNETLASNTHRQSHITAYSSLQQYPPRTQSSTYDVFGNGSSAYQASHGRSTTTDLEEHQRQRQQSESMRRWEREDGRDAPYNAVGYTRRDGEVYDEDEVYEEYREYDYDDARNDAWC